MVVNGIDHLVEETVVGINHRVGESMVVGINN